MNSPRRRPDRAIESVELRISFSADKETSKRVREAIPSAVLKKGVCLVRIDAKGPEEVADQAKEILDRIRDIDMHRPKGQ
jgi:hypothetical protein